MNITKLAAIGIFLAATLAFSNMHFAEAVPAQAKQLSPKSFGAKNKSSVCSHSDCFGMNGEAQSDKYKHIMKQKLAEQKRAEQYLKTIYKF